MTDGWRSSLLFETMNQLIGKLTKKTNNQQWADQQWTTQQWTKFKTMNQPTLQNMMKQWIPTSWNQYEMVQNLGIKQKWLIYSQVFLQLEYENEQKTNL